MSSEGDLKRTPLYHVHVEAGARMVPFGGWEMPVQYAGIITEHKNVREACGLFDLSHMGEIEVTGERALEFVQKVTTNNAASLAPGQVQYSIMCRPDGGIVDDILVYRDTDRFILVVNASNTTKDYEWLRSQAAGGVKLENKSDDTALIAIQGPRSEEVLAPLTDVDLGQLGYYRFTRGSVSGAQALISRTGYTGEDGFEIYVSPEDSETVWREIMQEGERFGIMPVGLGARDSLRLEMAYSLYGHEINESTTPVEAGLMWVVKPAKGDFIGRQAILEAKAKGPDRKIIGFELTGRNVPRQGFLIEKDGQVIGEVTSGTFSPTLEKSIGLAYIDVAQASVGNSVDVVIRDKRIPATLVSTPFVQPRVKKG